MTALEIVSGEVVPTLDALADEIREAHAAAGRDFESAVDHARRAGERLNDAKAQVAHGKWLPWLKANFEFTRQTAADYMRLAVKCSEDTTFAPRSVEAGLRAIAGPGDGPTTAERLVASGENEWYTPAKYLAAAREVLGGIDLDPATSELANEVVRATRFYTQADDGLNQAWSGRLWLNPPYGRLAGDFIERLVAEHLGDNIDSAIALVNAHCTDTAWFQALWSYPLCFTDHRIDFESAGREKHNTSTHGSVFAYLGPDNKAFKKHFAEFGAVVTRA